MEELTLVNRAPFNVEGLWDGEITIFKPGQKATFPYHQAVAYREQNPIMGTEDYFTGDCKFKLACADLGDDVKPLPKDFDDSHIRERFDRSTMPGPAPQIQPVPDYVNRAEPQLATT